MSQNHDSRFLPALLAATLALGSSPALAQEAEPRRADYTQPPIVSLEFDGGTLAHFVKALRHAEPKINIVMHEDAASAMVPAMEIHAAGVDQILDSACSVAKSDKRITYSQNRGSGEPVFAILAIGNPKQQVTAMVTGGGAAKSQGQDRTMVLSLNRLIDGIPSSGVDGMKVETVLSALEVGATFGGKEPTMKFHADSGLLFLRGSTRQLGLASEVLSILERDLQQRAMSGAATRQPTTAPNKKSR